MLKLLSIISILLCSPICMAIQADKCDINIEYLYYYFYEPESLMKFGENGIVGASNDSSNIMGVKQDNQDSAISSEDTTCFVGKVDELDSIHNISDPKIFDDWITAGIPAKYHPALIYKSIDSTIPYISANLVYSGDGSDLVALGVDTCLKTSNTVIVTFPLSLLPDILLLNTVELIYLGPYIKLNSIQSDESYNPDIGSSDVRTVH